MNKTLVQNPEHDIHGCKRGDDEKPPRGLRLLISLGRALESGMYGRGNAALPRGIKNVLNRGTERRPRSEIEGECDGRINSLVIDRKRGAGRLVVSKSAKGDQLMAGGRHV